MKSSILLTIAILSSFFLTDMNAYAAAAPVPQTTSNQDNNQWVEIGEVTMKYRVLIDTQIGPQYTDRKCTGILYVCYIGNRIIYRVNYNGKMYSVRKNANNRGEIIVNGNEYTFDLPTM